MTAAPAKPLAPAPPGAGSSPPRYRYHFHAPGVLYIIVTIVLALGAINSQNNLLFAALGLALSALVVSGLVSGASLARVRVARTVPPSTDAGEPLHVRYTVANTSRFATAFGLTISEALESDGPGPAAEPGPARAFVLHVGPGGTAEAEAVVTPRQRGVLRLGEVRISSTFPFGLARKSVSFHLPANVLVRPPRLSLSPDALAALRTEANGRRGVRPSLDDDFYGLRDFDAADPPAKVAWKVSARLDRPVVRHEPPRSLPRVWLLVQLPPAPAHSGADRDSELALALAGSLIRAAAARGISVGLAIPSAHVLHPPRSGARHADELLDQLAVVQAPAGLAPPRFRAPPPLRGEPTILIAARVAEVAKVPQGTTRMGTAEISRYIAAPLPELLAQASEPAPAGGRP